MKTIITNKIKAAFWSIKTGNHFLFNENIYVKVTDMIDCSSNLKFNAINIKTGRGKYFGIHEKIEKLSIKEIKVAII